jgi:hypothetical protein
MLLSGQKEESGKGCNKSIPCCIVDDHCDIVPFLHALWRSKKLSLSNLSYFHIDSHPDLTPPAADVHSLTNLSMLYDLLENTEGNISEFILPLSINGHIDQIFWLHQSFCLQFSAQTSNYSFYLGNDMSNQTIGVTCPEAYYLDEGLVYELEELESQSVHKVNFFSCCDADFVLSPSSLSSLFLIRDSTSSALAPAERREWILDICLDYFTVSNPFLIELQRQLEREKDSIVILGYSVEKIISMIQQTILFLSFRCSHSETCSYHQRTFSDRRHDRKDFLSLFSEIMSTSLFPSADSTLFPRFLELFDCTCQVIGDSDHIAPRSQAELFLEMISRLSLSTRQSILKSGLRHHLVA